MEVFQKIQVLKYQLGLFKNARGVTRLPPPPPPFFFFISLLAGVRRAPCKSFFELEACLPGRTERAGLMRGTCSTEGGKKQQNNGARNFTRQLGGGGVEL